MKKMIIKEHSLLLEFKHKVKEYVEVDFPIEYFQDNFIRGFFDENNNLIGGYALIVNAPFRVLRSIPTEYQLPCKESEIFEVTALWLDPEYSNGSASVQFWLQFAIDTYKQKNKKYYLFSYPKEKTKLKSLYAHANPIDIYSGPVKILEGNLNEEQIEETINLALRKKMVLLPFTAAKALFKKFKNDNKRQKISINSILRNIYEYGRD